MRNNKLFGIIVAIFFFIGCSKNKIKEDEIKNDVVGYWQGYLYQKDGIPTQYFPFMIKIDAEGEHLYGRSEIKPENASEYFGIMSFNAKFAKTILKYEEDKITKEKVGNWHWCLKSSDLKYDRKTKTLSGDWNSAGCNSGSILVQKFDIGKTFFCNNEEIVIEAVGQNLKWYNNARLTNLLGQGNVFKPQMSFSTIYYVTQTIDGIESLPIPVSIELIDCN